ncbi:MAG: DNA polymerase III subunit gamma/tau, partial [Deltaproteobacteria bacterium]|nr:DNA polymerase III subunit gamma/tau [Deltaproteobacteria bacterium]
AILFSGPRGTGKTSVARILAKAMNCEKGPAPIPCNTCRSCREITAGNAVDVFEIDGASNNGVDHIRELRENIKYMPAHSPFKIYIIDEVHMLSMAAFNALLKTLEEPPSHIMFIFATTEPHKIPITILSRCQRHDFRRISLDAITSHLESLCIQEEADIAVESLGLIAREADGSMRDALSLLDQAMTCTEGSVSHAQILDILGVIDRKIIFDFSRAVLQKDITCIIDIIDEIYHRGHGIKKFYLNLMEHFRNLLVVKMGRKIDKLVDVPAHEIELMADQIKNISDTFLSQIIDLLFKEENTIKFSSQPKLALEMVFIRIFQIQPSLSIDLLIEKLDALKNGIPWPDKDNSHNNVPPVTYSESEKPQGMVREATSQNSPVPLLTQEPPPASTLNHDEPIDNIRERVLDILPEQHIATYLENSTFKYLNDQCIKIEVTGNSFNCKRIKAPKNIAILKKICSDVVGKSMDIEINAIPIRDNKNKERADKAGQLKHEAINHPLVAKAVEVFNGKIVDVKIL